MSIAGRALNAAQIAETMDDLKAALYSADLGAMAAMYAGDLESVSRIAFPSTSPETAAALAREADRAVRIADSVMGLRPTMKPIEALRDAAESAGYNGAAVERHGPARIPAVDVAAYLAGEFVAKADRDSADSLRAAVSAAMDWLAAEVGRGALYSAVREALDVEAGRMIRAAEAKAAQAVQRAVADGLGGKIAEAIGALGEQPTAKQAADAYRAAQEAVLAAATQSGDKGFAARTAKPALDDAASKIAAALADQIGPDKLPDRIMRAASRVTNAEAIIGSLRADDERDLLRQINDALNSAEAAGKSGMWAELESLMDDANRKVAALRRDPDADAIYQQMMDEGRAMIRAKYRRQAMELVAKAIGVSVDELAEKQAALERAVQGWQASAYSAGAAILEHVRSLTGVTKGEAVKTMRAMTERDASAARMIAKTGENMDDVLTEFFQVVGGMARGAGQARIMSLSEAKKRYPHKLGKRRDVKRAACYPGDYYTATGGEDYGLVTLGTASHDKRTLWHELGHWIEHNNPLARAIVRQFFARRTAGERPVSLASLLPRHGYRRDEIALRDQFINPYMGKIYSSGSTEILSMGLEYLSSPELAAKLAKEDPDMLSMLLKIIEVTNAL